MPGKGLHGRGALGALSVLTGTLATVVAAVAFAAPGDLDTSFSEDGRATINLGGMEDVYWADVAVTPDGGSVVVGTSQADFGQPLTIAVAKLLPNGELDPSFSGDGKLILSRGIGAYAYAVAAQPDGKIVIAGTHDEQGAEFFDVVRVNADGTPDASFGSQGFRSIFLNTPLAEAYDVAIAPSGNIVAAGYAGSYSQENNVENKNYDLVVVRLSPNGGPDGTFSGDGIAKPASPNSDLAQAVALQPNGKILVAGEKNDDMTVTRFNADGTIDTGFGTGGQATPSFSGDTEANGIALQPNGKMVLAGYRYMNGRNDVAIARLDASGALDPTFSDDGEIVSDLGSSRDFAFSAAIQQNGKVVVGASGGPNGDLYGLRFDVSGIPDASFGGDGVVTVDFASDGDEGGDVAIQPDGQILLSGVTDNNDDLAVARLEGDPTAADPPPPPGDGDPTDTTAPETTITKTPKNKSHKPRAKYRFTSSEPNSTFECALDSKTFESCDAGRIRYKRLDFGKHKFAVRATDPAGNTDLTPDKDKFKRKP